MHAQLREATTGSRALEEDVGGVLMSPLAESTGQEGSAREVICWDEKCVSEACTLRRCVAVDLCEALLPVPVVLLVVKVVLHEQYL